MAPQNQVLGVIGLLFLNQVQHSGLRIGIAAAPTKIPDLGTLYSVGWPKQKKRKKKEIGSCLNENKFFLELQLTNRLHT